MTQFTEVGLMLFLFLCCFRSTLAGYIANPPVNGIAVEGGKTQIVCIVQDLDEGEVVRLFKDSTKVSEGATMVEPLNRYQLKVNKDDGHYIIVINPVKRTDGDSTYSCGIFKGDEEIYLSEKAKITIIEIPNPIYPECQNIPREYRNGEHVTLSCTSENVNPKPTMRWLTDERNLDFNEDIYDNKIWLTHKIRITPDLDGKIFICNLKAAAKVERNCTVGPLNVVYKPQVELNGESSVKEGNVYICSVKANPKVTKYRWKFTPEISMDQYKIETGDQTLRLNKLLPSQNATIMQCEATNRIGTTTVSKILYLPTSDNFVPNSETNTGQQSKNNGKMSSTKILSFVGSCLLLLACLMAVLLCIFVAHSRRYLPGVRVPQPDVYFMPKDSISTMGRSAPQTAGTWKRSIGTQVPSDLDRESIYLEIGERKTLM